jgi:hypothetical protein
MASEQKDTGNPVSAKLGEFVNYGHNIQETADYERWRLRVLGVLDQVLPTAALEFRAIRAPTWVDQMASELGFLEGLRLKTDLAADKPSERPNSSEEPITNPPEAAAINRKVFIVHGHDGGTKESVARFIQTIGLQPIILHEQPNSGRTIIEKFEVAADVGFAVVLLTADDVGASAKKPNESRPRARQNVIMELGYFMGKLSRRRVCPCTRPQ